MYIQNNNIWGMNSYVCMFFQISAQRVDLDGAKDILFSQFLCEKKIFFAPIQTILDGYDNELLLHVFFLKYFFLKCLSYYRTTLTTRNLPYNIVPCKQGNNVAAPPLSKIMPKHDEDLSSNSKKISTDSWGQCTLF
jgi:hypothetical protein